MKTWYRIHKWTSLVSTAFLLLLCVTGLPLIFAHEIDHALGHDIEPPPYSGPETFADVDAIVRDALERGEGEAVQFLVADPDEPALLFVRLGRSSKSSDISDFLAFDTRSGDFLHRYDLEGGFMNVMRRLHIDLYAGLPGTLFLGAMGLLLLAALVSGAVLYAPFMRRLPFGTVRRRRSPLVRWLDIHNLLGISTLMWLAVVGGTGVVNALSIPIFSYWQDHQLAEMLAPYRTAEALDGYGSPTAALASARAAVPDGDLSFMAFPGNEFAGPRHYVAFMQGDTPWRSQLLTPVLIDATSGTALDRADLPWYVSALLLSQPLHFGDYGGLPLKLLWAVFDLVAIVVLSSGLYLWTKGRRLSFEDWWASMNADNFAQAGDRP